MKGPILQKRWDNLSNERKQRIQDRAHQLEQEYLTLQELRKAHQLTQEHMAKVLDVRQESISKLENRSNMMISTLRAYYRSYGWRTQLSCLIPR